MSDKEIPQRPYLLRAMHEWITDSGQTPHIVANAESGDIDVPVQHVHDGKIILNIGFAAVQNLDLGNQEICFQARFSGAPYRVRVPVSAVLGIYAKETSQGMIFSDEATVNPDEHVDADRDSADRSDDTSPDSGRPHLRIIK